MLAVTIMLLPLACEQANEPTIPAFSLQHGIAITDINYDGAADIVVASATYGV